MTTVLLSRDRRRVRGPLSSALRHESACRHLLVAAAAPTPHRHSAPRPPPRHSGESRKPRTSYQWTMVSPDPRGRGPRLSPGRLGWDGGPPVFHPPTPRHSGESRKPRTPDPRGQRVDSILRYPKRGGDVDPGFRPPPPPPPRHSGESRKPRAPAGIPLPSPGGNQIKRITVQDHAAPQPPGTWTPAFAPPPVIPAKAGNHAAHQPPGTWTPAFAGETE